ncbi:Glycoside hydrolase, family 18, catalytic domain-containing protein [Paramicrosporidium saccamoebae]|uniref:Glycoside hydrolase, family 18, catalytic domain-containing protein n=1 Tax=Paramicrosporidium saccamoebae TaxID=1246581 RepID=A0A2H9THR4_9FUNG|nr:Glycoside hydrolase, family 18, catalytic domain-containing protein [Paramicrosporidium saccamoebae]
MLVSVAYFISWGIYARNFNVWNINPTGLTHINYAFANIADGKVVLGDPWADTDKVNEGHGDSWNDPPNYLHGNFYQLFRLKQQYRWIKTGISVGGWTWSGSFSNIAATDAGRKMFVTSALNFILTYGMDYVDLDWEYPVSGGLPENSRRPEDGTNLVLLLQEFKRQIAAYPGRNIKVTMAVSCGLVTLVNYKLAQMDPYIDYYNMMCYDFTGSFSPVADHQSNLFGRDASVDSVIKAVDYAIASGADRKKLVIGVPIYGRGFAQCSGLTQPFSGGGPGTWEPGVYDQKVLPLAGCTQLWEPVSNASFCYNQASKMLISYDTPTSVSYKMQWLLSMGLGGSMFWELSADYPFSSDQSLQRMINIWLGPYLDKSNNELCYPMSPYGNINNVAGCSPARRLRDNFRPDEKYIESHSPFKSPRNRLALFYPRAHYNYTAFAQSGRCPRWFVDVLPPAPVPVEPK